MNNTQSPVNLLDRNPMLNASGMRLLMGLPDDNRGRRQAEFFLAQATRELQDRRKMEADNEARRRAATHHKSPVEILSRMPGVTAEGMRIFLGLQNTDEALRHASRQLYYARKTLHRSMDERLARKLLNIACRQAGLDLRRAYVPGECPVKFFKQMNVREWGEYLDSLVVNLVPEEMPERPYLPQVKAMIFRQDAVACECDVCRGAARQTATAGR